jgi:hypothetical protein
MSSTPEHPGKDRPDEFDRVLTAYFRAEVPSPWPSPPTPETTRPVPVMRNQRLSHSRLVLAASIATLLLGTWLLTGNRIGPANSGVSLQDGAAKVPMDLRPDSAPRGR